MSFTFILLIVAFIAIARIIYNYFKGKNNIKKTLLKIAVVIVLFIILRFMLLWGFRNFIVGMTSSLREMDLNYTNNKVKFVGKTMAGEIDRLIYYEGEKYNAILIKWRKGFVFKNKLEDLNFKIYKNSKYSRVFNKKRINEKLVCRYLDITEFHRKGKPGKEIAFFGDLSLKEIKSNLSNTRVFEGEMKSIAISNFMGAYVIEFNKRKKAKIVYFINEKIPYTFILYENKIKNFDSEMKSKFIDMLNKDVHNFVRQT